MELTKNQVGILEHTRSRAANGLFCGDSPDMQVLVKAELMVSVGKKSFVPDEYFKLTSAGKSELDRRAKEDWHVGPEMRKQLLVLARHLKERQEFDVGGYIEDRVDHLLSSLGYAEERLKHLAGTADEEEKS